MKITKADGTVLAMNYRRKKVSMKEQLEEATAEIGGEPLDGSGFEGDTADQGFTVSETAAPEIHSRHAQ